MKTQAPLTAPIFRSDAQARLLSEVVMRDHELSIADIATNTGLSYTTVHREVTRLQQAGILTERLVGRARMIASNLKSPLIKPLREILAIATGPVVFLKQALASIPGIEAAFLYGSFAARLQGIEGLAPNDIDLMVIGTPKAEQIYAACAEVEKDAKRPVNPTIYTPAEFAKDTGFLNTVRSRPVIPIIGELPWQ